MRLYPGRTVKPRRAAITTLLVLLCVPLGPATAADSGAVANGNWSSASTWTTGVPGLNDNAYIGSVYPAGAGGNATVALTQNSQASTVYLGYGPGTAGTVDLHGSYLIANNLYLGENGGTGTIQRTGGGSLLIGSSISENGGSFSLAPFDQTAQLNISNGATATIAAVGNVTGGIQIDPGSAATLGADINLANTLDLRGTINANGHAIAAEIIDLGSSGGPFLLSNRGQISAGRLNVSSQYSPSQTTFNLIAGDSIGNLTLAGVNTTIPAGAVVANLTLSSNGASPPVYATAATSAVNNLSNYVTIGPGCTLTQGADLNVVNDLNVYGTLNGNGHALSMSNGVVYVYSGGTLTLGADFSATTLMRVYGTVNANGHAITAPAVYLGSFSAGLWTLADRGPMTVTSLSVSSPVGQPQLTFDLTIADAVTNFGLNGTVTALRAGVSVQGLFLASNGDSPPTNAIATTANVGNVTRYAQVNSGCLLTLGADLSLTDTLDLRGTLNANGHAISAGTILLGYYGGPFTLADRGTITASTLTVSSQYSPTQTTFNLTAADTVTTNLNLYGVGTILPAEISVQNLNLYSNGALPPTYAVANTAAAGNVTSSASVTPGCTLTLGADLNLTTYLDMSGGLNANGYAVSAPSAYFGRTGGPVAFRNDGLVTVGVWNQTAGSQVQLHQPGDTLGSILLSANSALTIGDAAGQTSGLILTGSSPGDLSIDATSRLVFEVNGLANSWVFRWADPSGGDHIADLQSLINGGEITFAYSNGGSYSLTSDGTYTYIDVIPVPEPSSFALLGVVGIGLARLRRRRQLVGWGYSSSCFFAPRKSDRRNDMLQSAPLPLNHRRIVMPRIGPTAVLASLVSTFAAAAPVNAPPWTPDMQSVADGSGRFAFDLYSRLRSGTGNLFLSPYSAHAALAMAADGANGATREQMVKVLHLPTDRYKALAAGDVGAYYGRTGKPYELAVANGLWGQRGFPWKPAFVARQRGRFGADLAEVDFAGDGGAARQRINAWASEKTRGKIAEALGPNDISPLTRTVLVNAVYFKSDWKTKFDKASTADAPFHLADGGKVTAPLMHQESEFRYAVSDGAQVLDLPYKGGELSMVVLLPAKPDGLPAVEKIASAESVAKWLAAARERPVRVWLPRFRIESGSSLGEALAGLGMPAAFDLAAADFSGLADEKIAISKVIQKGYVDVNEEGTEAAVVSGIFSNAPSPVPPPPVDFRADRPFLFLIRDAAHGTILFMGRVTNPKG